MISELGRGGMGVVCHVRRVEEAFHQDGALKILPVELLGSGAERRFGAEREILAELSHPNIAKLLDGGQGPGGRPYFVMERVQGVPIDAHCDERRLDVKRRLRLFLTVCGAVRHAHQSLVVHRDLKPSNILVNAEGVPKLLDFGIAKLLTEGLEDAVGGLTLDGSRLFTPGFASPEQRQGGAITTASDVYQLGVLLYLLLTGRHPFDDAATPGAAGRDLAPAVSPSRCFADDQEDARGRAEARKTTPERLRRQLAGDLDSIVLKALRPEPSQRYGTAGELASDVSRHLDRRPVLARRDTVAYRTGKLLRRHGTAAAAVLGLFFSVATFAVGAQRRANQTAVERDRARQVVDFLVELFADADPYRTRGDEITVREVLDRGAQRTRAELHEQPLVQATLLEAIGEVYRSLGHLETSSDLRGEALEARRRTMPSDHPGLAGPLTRAALIRAEQGDFEAVDTLLPLALTLLRGADDATSEEYSSTLNDIGYTWQVRGNLDRAEPLLEEALRVREQAQDTSAPLGPVLNNLGNVRWARGDLDSAAVLLRRSVAARRSLPYEDPRLPSSLESLADILQRLGALDEAEEAAVEALDVRRRTLPEGHSRLAGPLHIRGIIMRQRGRPAEAEPLLREALEIRMAALGEDHFVVANGRNGLALVLEDLGRLDEAEEMFRRSLEVYAERFGEDHINPVYVEANLARLLSRKGEEEEARALFEHALPIARRERPDNRLFAADLITLGLSYCRMPSRQAADSTLAQAVEALRPDQGLDAPDDFLRALNAHGSCLYFLDDHDRAERILNESLEVSGDRADDDPYRAFALQVLRNMGRLR